MSMGGFHDSSPGSDDDLLRETEGGDGEPTGGAPSEGSFTMFSLPTCEEQSN